MVGYSIFTPVSKGLISIVIHKIRTLNMKYDTQSKVTDVLKIFLIFTGSWCNRKCVTFNKKIINLGIF